MHSRWSGYYQQIYFYTETFVFRVLNCSKLCQFSKTACSQLEYNWNTSTGFVLLCTVAGHIFIKISIKECVNFQISSKAKSYEAVVYWWVYNSNVTTSVESEGSWGHQTFWHKSRDLLDSFESLHTHTHLSHSTRRHTSTFSGDVLLDWKLQYINKNSFSSSPLCFGADSLVPALDSVVYSGRDMKQKDQDLHVFIFRLMFPSSLYTLTSSFEP